MSSKKRTTPIFPNRKSAIITIVTIVLLLMFAVVAIHQNNVSRLKKYAREAHAAFEQSMDAMDERFSYSESLFLLMEEEGYVVPQETIVDLYDRSLPLSQLSKLYIALDSELAVLQKQSFTSEFYPLYAAYFEKIYEAELKLIPQVNLYNDKAAFYNVQIGSFLATIAAKQLGMKSLELFSLAPAIKGRP